MSVERGYLHMAWHLSNPDSITNVEKFEDEALEKTRILPKRKLNRSSKFAHIFGLGYSSTYYSYQWAQVLDADAFELFKENGIFDKETANSFRKNILAKGNTEHPMELYKRFRGQEPDPKALLRRMGLDK